MKTKLLSTQSSIQRYSRPTVFDPHDDSIVVYCTHPGATGVEIAVFPYAIDYYQNYLNNVSTLRHTVEKTFNLHVNSTNIDYWPYVYLTNGFGGDLRYDITISCTDIYDANNNLVLPATSLFIHARDLMNITLDQQGAVSLLNGTYKLPETFDVDINVLLTQEIAIY